MMRPSCRWKASHCAVIAPAASCPGVRGAGVRGGERAGRAPFSAAQGVVRPADGSRRGRSPRELPPRGAFPSEAFPSETFPRGVPPGEALDRGLPRNHPTRGCRAAPPCLRSSPSWTLAPGRSFPGPCERHHDALGRIPSAPIPAPIPSAPTRRTPASVPRPLAAFPKVLALVAPTSFHSSPRRASHPGEMRPPFGAAVPRRLPCRAARFPGIVRQRPFACAASSL